MAKPMKRRNGSGSVVKLSGRRRCPFEVRVNTHMDERNYPVYDVLGRFSERDEALAALLEYNKNPYDLAINELTFEDVYKLWFDWKYTNGQKKYSDSSVRCTSTAYKKCSSLYGMKFKDIRTPHIQAILNSQDMSHATLEHVKNTINQMFKYALQFDIVQKDYSKFAFIAKPDDDEHGVPFNNEDINSLWNSLDIAWVDSILIYIYSGFRLSELLNMPVADINIHDMTFTGGIKTAAGKNRIVPIHSKIQPLVLSRLQHARRTLFDVSIYEYYACFNNALAAANITEKHTPHDCRHTFSTLLDNAGANPNNVKRLMGHSLSKDITQNIYTHKDIEQLRKTIELI